MTVFWWKRLEGIEVEKFGQYEAPCFPPAGETRLPGKMELYRIGHPALPAIDDSADKKFTG